MADLCVFVAGRVRGPLTAVFIGMLMNGRSWEQNGSEAVAASLLVILPSFVRLC